MVDPTSTFVVLPTNKWKLGSRLVVVCVWWCLLRRTTDVVAPWLHPDNDGVVSLLLMEKDGGNDNTKIRLHFLFGGTAEQPGRPGWGKKHCSLFPVVGSQTVAALARSVGVTHLRFGQSRNYKQEGTRCYTPVESFPSSISSSLPCPPIPAFVSLRRTRPHLICTTLLFPNQPSSVFTSLSPFHEPEPAPPNHQTKPTRTATSCLLLLPHSPTTIIST